MASSLPARIAVAAIAIPLVAVLVFLGGWPLVLALQLLAVVGTWEVYRLATFRGVVPLAVPGYLAAAATPVAVYAAVIPGVAARWLAFLGVAWLIVVMMAAVAVTVFGPLYTAALPSSILYLRHGGSYDAMANTALVFLPLLVTWICDTAAMTGGAAFGGPKFAPVVSPNKTWAGTIAGSVAGTGVAVLYGWQVLSRVDIDLAWWKLAVIGFVLAGLGQVGDLAESLFKRDAAVKDSGTFFPGHGGVLDRLDSLYWVLPACAVLLTAWRVL